MPPTLSAGGASPPVCDPHWDPVSLLSAATSYKTTNYTEGQSFSDPLCWRGMTSL